MKKICLFIIVSFVLSIGYIHSQNIQPYDMLMSSQTYSWGTARSIGMAGSFGSLGGDLSSMSINPAGIGVYRSSEFSISPSVNYNNSISTFYGKTNEDFSEKFNLGNIGGVLTFNTNKDIGWVSTSIGFAYNRLNDFNRRIIMNTPSATSSLLDEFAYYANGGDGIDPDNLSGPSNPQDLYKYYEGLAYETYALDNFLFGNDWYHSQYSIDHKYGQFQERQKTTKGGIGEYAFSFGANISHKFYFGATLGIQKLIYNAETRHTEEDRSNSVVDLNLFDFYEYSDIYGEGYNLKLGVIYKPVDLIRLGLSVHTPTMYDLESTFSTYMYSQYDSNIIPDGNGNYTQNESYASTDERSETYRLRTPWKLIGSLGLQLMKFGVINVDYERVNYSHMRLSGDYLKYQNDDVKNMYKATNNLRIGGEFKIANVALRGGYGLNQTPYKDKDLSFIDYEMYSAGLGYRGSKFFVDFACYFLNYPEKYKLYDFVERERTNGTDVEVYNLKEPVIADLSNDVSRFVLTVGFRF